MYRINREQDPSMMQVKKKTIQAQKPDVKVSHRTDPSACAIHPAPAK
jgi:hypothetical protein